MVTIHSSSRRLSVSRMAQEEGHDEIEEFTTSEGSSFLGSIGRFLGRKRMEFQRYVTANKAQPAAKKFKPGPGLRTFDPTNAKSKVEYGPVRKALGDLLDREGSKSDFIKGIEKLAEVRGNPQLDKKEVPLLAVAAPSESGKTEFLKWIHNNCCTCLEGERTDVAGLVLDHINEAAPDGQKRFTNILVLFASFNQTSTFNDEIENKSNIVRTTIERLLRSYEGNLQMSATTRSSYDHLHFEGFEEFIDIVQAVKQVRGETAFIFCIDELSTIRKKNKEAYTHLLEQLQEFSHVQLANGEFCAIVAASLRIVELGEIVLQQSGRAMSPIYFPIEKPEIREKSIEMFFQSSRALSTPAAYAEDSKLKMQIITSILESSTSIYKWHDICLPAKGQTEIKVPDMGCALPVGYNAEDVFELCSRTLFHTQRAFQLNGDTVEVIIDKLHGSVRLAEGVNGVVTEWANLNVKYSLPPHRVLQLHSPTNISGGTAIDFKYVQSWTIVAVYKLYYECDPSRIVKDWELATVALLDLRRAMQYVAYDKIQPSLRQLFSLQADIPEDQTMHVHHNLYENLLDAVASQSPATHRHGQLPHELDTNALNGSPQVVTSGDVTEEGIEGVFVNAFRTADAQGIHVFFQMKLYKVSTPKEILDWLVAADLNAKKFGYHEGTYIIQVFVTGMIERNIDKYSPSWPKNSMVFGTEALHSLFKPFGNGFIVEMVERNRRKSEQKK